MSDSKGCNIFINLQYRSTPEKLNSKEKILKILGGGFIINAMTLSGLSTFIYDSSIYTTCLVGHVMVMSDVGEELLLLENNNNNTNVTTLLLLLLLQL